MSKTLRVLVQGVLFGGFVAVIPASAEGLSAPTFTKDVAPIFQEKCEACHRPDSIAPMSLVTFEEVAPVGAIDQEPRDDAPDAAVAHLQDRRHPALQERPIAERRPDRNDVALGRSGAPKGDPKDMPPPKVWPSEQGWNFAKHVQSDRARPDHPLDAVRR